MGTEQDIPMDNSDEQSSLYPHSGNLMLSSGQNSETSYDDRSGMNTTVSAGYL